jgi:hypothetical protein
MEAEPTTPLFPQTDFDKYCFMRAFVRFLRFEIGLITSERDEYRDLYYALKNRDRTDDVKIKKTRRLENEIAKLRRENASLATEVVRLRQAACMQEDIIPPNQAGLYQIGYNKLTPSSHDSLSNR